MQPTSLRPLPANTTRAARPTFFQTLGSAEAAQHRAARHESPTQCVTGIEYAPGILRAREGGRGFEIVIGGIDYEIREVSPLEIEQRIQAGIRRAVEEAYEAAAVEDAAAAKAKSTCFKLMHSGWAAKHRGRARELELKLRVSSVRRVIPLDCTESFTSGERDSRVSR